MTTCMECGKPWGIILERGEDPSEDLQRRCQAELIDMWLEQAECDHEEGVQFDVGRLPTCQPVMVVHITEALSGFASERFGSCVEAGWWNAADVDIPTWLLKGRAHRWAYRWDCCAIMWSDRYVLEVVS